MGFCCLHVPPGSFHICSRHFVYQTWVRLFLSLPLPQHIAFAPGPVKVPDKTSTQFGWRLEGQYVVYRGALCSPDSLGADTPQLLARRGQWGSWSWSWALSAGSGQVAGC